jgi:threonine/homoserine/homoserine lactone efflux protein
MADFGAAGVPMAAPAQIVQLSGKLYWNCNGEIRTVERFSPHLPPHLRPHPPAMPLAEFTALLALATAMSFTPGPNTTLSTALAANRGLGPAMRFVLAVPVGWSLLLLLCAGGLGAVVVAAPMLRLAIKALGIAYLLWLAWKLAHSSTLAQADAARMQVGFWQGVALQFVNIKAWLLALTIVAGWVAGRADSLQRLAVVLPVMLLFALASNLLYASTGALLRQWLARGRRLLWFNRAMALVLALTALWMLRS